jgi:hypothetical protein
MDTYSPAYGGGAGGTGPGGALAPADVETALAHKLQTGHLAFNHTDGGLTYDDGIFHHNLAKMANDGHGAVYGTGAGDAFMLLGPNAKFGAIYASAARGLTTVTASDILSPEITSYLWTGTLAENKLNWETGLMAGTGYGSIGWRAVYKRQGTEEVLATTADEHVWAAAGVDGHGYGAIATTVADAISMATLAIPWPASTNTSLDILYEFKAPVKLKGTGTWGTTWELAWQDDRTPLTNGAVVYYDEWMVKTYGVNDKIVELGVIYRANTAGAQVGSFAANSALWTEVGNIPNILLWKGGISVTDFNLLASGVEGGMYRISEAGTLTGGQAAVIGDQVILNKDISVTVTAADFDFFENIEPGTVIPPWSAKTFVLDEAIYEQGELYYCSKAGAQITSFAANVGDWSHFSRIDSHLKFDTDGAYNVGSAANSAKRVYLTDGIYHDTNRVMELNATDVDIVSPDGLKKIGVRNTGLHLLNDGGSIKPWGSADILDLGTDGARFSKLYLKDSMYGPATFGIKSGTTNRFDYNGTRTLVSSPNGLTYTTVNNTEFKFFDTLRTRVLVDATEAKLISPDGTQTATVKNGQIALNDGVRDRVSVTAAQSVLLSPDGQKAVSAEDIGVKNTGYTRLGAAAPFIQQKKLTGTTSATEGGNVTIAHGLNRTKILAVSVIVDSGVNSMFPEYTFVSGYRFHVYWNDTTVVVVNHGTESELIRSKPIKVLITYEA